MLAEVRSQMDQLESLFRLASSQNDLQVQARLTEYLCVRVAGFVEQSARHVYYNHALRRSQPTIQRFVSTQLDRPQNLVSERLGQLVQSFAPQWKTDFDLFLTDERKSALNSVYGNRDRIAHGLGVSLGIAQLKAWYEKVVEIVEFLDAQAA